jgi:hypothetical protein
LTDKRYEIKGNPTPEEEEAILRALDDFLRRELEARRPSKWKTVGRAEALRTGILDFRSRLGDGAWPGAKSLPWRGKRYEGRHGRGDAR